ncbi:uncharacterized protein TM35_000161080 [Trypanosoma theileri]|uniref:Uncharacterized protein n=1 Tax=Trypanosoma theileri TaxID=67003 RepID=A0A1X0NWI3_9TRYP|nr:uncharacterized protein TM35_000161080 [Trypanosoma theileri]ORC88470.1 hypothetical protein TM35_000161080 [Trypanosoma theileri]
MKTHKNDEIVDSMGTIFQEMCRRLDGAEASSQHLQKVTHEWISFTQTLQEEEDAVAALSHSLSSFFLPLVEEVVVLLHELETVLDGKKCCDEKAPLTPS